jgi:hypothetical protein
MRALILSDNPVFLDRLRRPLIILACKSTHTTLPVLPTSLAIGKEKNPIPHPTSRTFIPSLTCGFKMSSGEYKNRLKGLASKKPNHQGHTLLLNSQFLQEGNFLYTFPLLFTPPNLLRVTDPLPNPQGFSGLFTILPYLRLCFTP